jgi:hypothetical protein
MRGYLTLVMNTAKHWLEQEERSLLRAWIDK